MLDVLNQRFGPLLADPVSICVAWVADIESDDGLVPHKGSEQFTEPDRRDQGLADVQLHYALVHGESLCQNCDPVVSQHVLPKVESGDSKLILPKKLDQLKH